MEDHELIKKYDLESEGITGNQVEYIKSLYNNIKNPEHKKQFDSKMELLGNLTAQEIFVLIEELKRKSPITFIQNLSIMQQFDESDIRNILKKDPSELTQKDAELLMSGPDKFNPWIKEHPLISEDEWEYGWQESDQFKDGKMFYLKFYNMLMLDIDNQDIDTITEKLNKFKKFGFRIYQSHGGYHVFITSELIKYNDLTVFQLTKVMGGDIYYAMFCNKTGYKIRLSPKLNRNEDFVYKYIKDVGTREIDETCEYLIELHDSMIIINHNTK